MFQNRNTLAHRLGKTTHVSSLRIKLKRIAKKYPLPDARCFEDWLLEVANARGARIVSRPNSALGKFVPPDGDLVSNEELITGICQLQCLDFPQMLRVAAQLISRGAFELDVGAITLAGKGEIREEDWDGYPTGLTVSEGKTISLIGGNTEIRKGTYFEYYDEYDDAYYTYSTGSLNAFEGQINMASVSSSGEVVPTTDGLDMFSIEKMGNISISDKSFVDVRGNISGSIFVRGGQFFLDNSNIESETESKDGGIIDIRVDHLSLKSGHIYGGTGGIGKGGDIIIYASQSVNLLENTGGEISTIFTNTYNDEYGHSSLFFANTTSKTADAGDAGSILIKTKDLSLNDGAYITAYSKGSGISGNIGQRYKRLLNPRH